MVRAEWILFVQVVPQSKFLFRSSQARRFRTGLRRRSEAGQAIEGEADAPSTGGAQAAQKPVPTSLRSRPSPRHPQDQSCYGEIPSMRTSSCPRVVVGLWLALPVRSSGRASPIRRAMGTDRPKGSRSRQGELRESRMTWPKCLLRWPQGWPLPEGAGAISLQPCHWGAPRTPGRTPSPPAADPIRAFR